jgi:hypothetical protein
MPSNFTPGPWRWEINLKHKTMHLCGGQNPFDLTIMDFDRWGMGGAVATLRDPAVDGMNIMHRLPDRMDWIEAFPGRQHHFDWCAAVKHPDMQLIEAAPDLLEALVACKHELEAVLRSINTDSVHFDGDEFHERMHNASAAIAKATGEAA